MNSAGSSPGLDHVEWPEPIWSEAVQANFVGRLNEERWAAISALAFLRQFEQLGIPEWTRANLPMVNLDIQRLADRLAWSGLPVDRRPSDVGPDDTFFHYIGDIVVADSEREPSLRPLVTACQNYCSEDAALCVGMGVLRAPYDSSTSMVGFPPFLDPVISMEELMSSERASEFVAWGHIVRAENGSLEWDDMPQCYWSGASTVLPFYSMP